MMKRYSKNERGVALIFAIGLLSLLLVIGLAFVANALNAKKVAANNSGRTQSKMFALSAVNRAAASVTLYQNQIFLDSTLTMPSDFSGIFSKGEVNNSGKGEVNNSGIFTNDGLLDKNHSRSLLRIPEDNSVFTKEMAKVFNKPYDNNSSKKWQGSWVYFYNTSDTANRRIVGRAAWQVFSSAAQISAPLFFRGHLGEAKSSADISNKHRWGRGIFEVKLDHTKHFVNVPVMSGGEPVNYTGGRISDFTELYGNAASQKLITVNDDANEAELDKRWVERWLVPDPEVETDEADFAAWNSSATKISPECYYYQDTNKKTRTQLARFNISELFGPYTITDSGSGTQYNQIVNKITAYGVTANADPWYARFRIDSTATTGDTPQKLNSGYSILALTKDSCVYMPEDEYDYDVETSCNSVAYNADETTLAGNMQKSYHSGLPFLRRIGSSSDNHTFPDNSAVTPAVTGLEYLRKQIAANMNDYCDADSVPTSNVPASTWGTLVPTEANEPKYTGNEKTPYLYELGALVGFRESASSANKGMAMNLTGGRLTFSTTLKIAPVVKLAKIYQFANGEFNDLTSHVDFGKVEYTFKLNKINLKGLKITYTVDSVQQSWVCDAPGWSSEMTGDGVPASLQTLGTKLFKSTFNALNVTGQESSGTQSFGDISTSLYPLALPAASSWYQRSADSNLIADAAQYTFTLNDDDAEKILRKVKTGLSDAAYHSARISVQPTSLSAESILLTSFSAAPDRVVLLQGTNGLDYVRKFTQGFKWSSDTGIALDFVAGSGSAVKPDFVLGGIRNYDPRQNLNNNDWYPLGSANAAKSVLLAPVEDCAALNVTTLTALTDASGNQIVNVGEVNKGYGTDIITRTAENKYFSPAERKISDTFSVGDTETVGEPAYKSAAAHLSTAFIRNAPMMSPWELGLIHRGIKWQTINLKSSCDPNNPSQKIQLSSYNANGNVWNNSGTTYTGGDAGLLDQIKMTQQGATYGKINFNHLSEFYVDFDETRDIDIVTALFDGLTYREPLNSFIANSTRKNEANHWVFNGVATGTEIAYNAANFENALLRLSARSNRNELKSRAQIVDLSNGGGTLANAFGLASSGINDAEQEELIGKTIDLLTAEASSPNQVQIVVVAQSIKDVAGVQYRPATEDVTPLDGTDALKPDSNGLVHKTCAYGTFDAGIHSADDGKNVYFDEITGEVKMLVTLDRNPVTGRMSIRRIDYLE